MPFSSSPLQLKVLTFREKKSSLPHILTILDKALAKLTS